MKLRWTTPAVEVVGDLPTRRIFVSVRDNLHDIANNVMSKSELVSAGVLKVDADGNYVANTSRTTTALTTSSSYNTVTYKSIEFPVTSTLTPGTGYLNLYLTQNTRVIRCWYEVTGGFSGGGAATLGVRVRYDGVNYTNLINPSGIGSGWTAGLHDGVQTGAAANFSQKMTDTRTLEYVVGGDNITSGRAVIFIQYATIN